MKGKEDKDKSSPSLQSREGAEEMSSWKSGMKISELAVKNYQFTIVIFLMLVALGIYSFVKIPQA
jgi:hypothetical protein